MVDVKVQLSDVISLLSLCIAIITSIYNVYLNKKIYGPKIKVLFEKQWEYDEYKNVVESRYTDYNIIITNDSRHNVYEFYGIYEFTDCRGEIQQLNKTYNIGFFEHVINTFVSNQIYKSYFANFTDLKRLGIDRITFKFKYKINKKDKKFHEESFDISVITLADTSEKRFIRRD